MRLRERKKSKKKKIKKLARLTIFYQVDYVKKFIDLNLFDYVFESLTNLYNYRTIVRRTRKKYKKIKSLNKRRCIQLKVKIKSKI